MEGSDSSRELLDNVNVGITDVPPQFMMQRIGVEPAQLLSNELLPTHGGLVVDMTNNEYLPAVNYATEDLLDHDLTEEDRNLAAALVAVQLVQQQKQQQQLLHHQDSSNVIVSTNSLASLVSSSNLENNKIDVINDQQIVITHLHHNDSILKKALLTTTKDDFNIQIKNEIIDDSIQMQRDSDCENKNDARSSKKSLPHKKRISRKLQKKPAILRHRYKCNVCDCDQIFNTPEELSNHTACHQAVNMVIQPINFSCQICTAGFSDQLTFFQHLKAHYEPNFSTAQIGSTKVENRNPEKGEDQKDSLLSSLLPPLNCIYCNKTFRRQKAFEVHMRDAHNKVEDEFSEPEDLMEGIRNMVAANDDTTDEEQDSKVWHYATELPAQNSAIHVLQNPGQVCHMCGQIFNSNEEVLQHLQNCKVKVEAKLEQNSDSESKGRNRKKRRKNGHLFCPHCDRVFTHRNSLMYHMRGHTGERPHQCDICGKSFFAATALKVHMRLHSGDKPYKCENCGRHFRQWGDLKYHRISIHSDEKQYQCEYCGKDFARKYSLIVHRRIHTGEKNYRCEFCAKTFRASSYLQTHRRIHTGEKPHPCEVCGKPFRVRSDMKRHQNTHTRRRNPCATARMNATVSNISSAVIIRDNTDNSNALPEEGNTVINNDENDELVSDDESEVQYQIPRDPLETVREGTNTLFNNAHLLLCYPNDLTTRTMVETQWIPSNN